MAEITSTENKLDSINREISKLLMDKETRDITNMTKIGLLLMYSAFTINLNFENLTKEFNVLLKQK